MGKGKWNRKKGKGLFRDAEAVMIARCFCGMDLRCFDREVIELGYLTLP